MRKIKYLTDIPAVRRYLARIGAKASSLRRAVVRIKSGKYSRDVDVIHFAKDDGIVTCRNKDHLPTDVEQKAIRIVWAQVSFPELGGGTHIWQVTWSHQLFIMKCAFLCNFFYATAIMSVKVALLCFYYRLSPHRGGVEEEEVAAVVGVL